MENEIFNCWSKNRKINYGDYSDIDIGHIYDMIQSIVDQNNIQLKSDDQAVLDHRKAIKAAYPKNNTNV